MGFLKVAGPDLSRRDLCCYGEHRDSRSVGIKKAVDQMQIAGSAAAGTDGELTRQMRFGARRKTGHFLVADMHPLDLSLAANGIGDAIEAVADDAVDPLYAGECQGFHELISNGFRHAPLPG